MSSKIANTEKRKSVLQLWEEGMFASPSEAFTIVLGPVVKAKKKRKVLAI